MNDIPEIKGYKRVIGLILAAVLAFFTVLVEHVRRSGAFAFNTPAEQAATALQVIFYIVFFKSLYEVSPCPLRLFNGCLTVVLQYKTVKQPLNNR